MDGGCSGPGQTWILNTILAWWLLPQVPSKTKLTATLPEKCWARDRPYSTPLTSIRTQLLLCIHVTSCHYVSKSPRPFCDDSRGNLSYFWDFVSKHFVFPWTLAIPPSHWPLPSRDLCPPVHFLNILPWYLSVHRVFSPSRRYHLTQGFLPPVF